MTPLNSSYKTPSHDPTDNTASESELNPENNGEIGFISFNIHSKNTSMSTGFLELSRDAIHFKPGSSYTKLLGGPNIGVPSTVVLYWKFHRSWTQPWTWRIEKPFIFVDQIDLESMEYGVKLVYQIDDTDIFI